jgi:hypothetical protein
MVTKILERDIQRAIVDYLVMTGWLVLRINAGAVTHNYKGKNRFVRFVYWLCSGREAQVAGLPDLLAFRGGNALAIECKAPGKGDETSPEQDEFCAEFMNHGGIYIVVDDLEQVIEYIEWIEAGYSVEDIYKAEGTNSVRDVTADDCGTENYAYEPIVGTSVISHTSLGPTAIMWNGERWVSAKT